MSVVFVKDMFVIIAKQQQKQTNKNSYTLEEFAYILAKLSIFYLVTRQTRRNVFII